MDNFYSTTGVPESFLHVLLASKIKYYSFYCLDVLKEISIYCSRIILPSLKCILQTNNNIEQLDPLYWQRGRLSLSLWSEIFGQIKFAILHIKSLDCYQQYSVVPWKQCDSYFIWENTTAKPPQYTLKKLKTLKISIL